MSRQRELAFLYIFESGSYNVGSFAKVRGAFEDGSVVFRRGIDRQTYTGIEKVLQLRYFDKSPGVKCKYTLLHWYACDSSKKDFPCAASIECRLGRQKKTFHFRCSSLFVSNLEWLRSARTRKELNYLKWNGVDTHARKRTSGGITWRWS